MTQSSTSITTEKKSLAQTSLSCGICGESRLTPLYTGPIRLGKPGEFSKTDHTVYRCETCDTRFLADTIEDIAGFYESTEYRNAVNPDADAETYYALHDQEQLRHLSVTGTGAFRNRIIADIGCGAGAFLDLARGAAKQVIAIEPSAVFQETLKAKGCAVYPYAGEALKDWAGKVDLVVSFDVVEHVADPVGFLADIRKLLKPGGRLVISTPNADDILLESAKEAFEPFFYRKVHLWYFTPKAFQAALEKAGFTKIRLIPQQTFGMSNFLGWVNEGRPTGDGPLPAHITPTMDAVWRRELEATGRANLLFADVTV